MEKVEELALIDKELILIKALENLKKYKTDRKYIISPVCLDVSLLQKD